MPSELLIAVPPVAPSGAPPESRPDSVAMSRFTTLLNAVQKWAAEHERATKIYLLADGERFDLFVVPRSATYDFDLRRALSDLLLALADRGYTVLGSLVPDGSPDELRAYFDPDQALVLYRQ